MRLQHAKAASHVEIVRRDVLNETLANAPFFHFKLPH